MELLIQRQINTPHGIDHFLYCSHALNLLFEKLLELRVLRATGIRIGRVTRQSLTYGSLFVKIDCGLDEFCLHPNFHIKPNSILVGLIFAQGHLSRLQFIRNLYYHIFGSLFIIIGLHLLQYRIISVVQMIWRPTVYRFAYLLCSSISIVNL